jgi:hypothetical protein
MPNKGKMTKARATNPPPPPARVRVRGRVPDQPAEPPAEPAESPNPISGKSCTENRRSAGYQIGYGRPPLHSRVQPGEKLNPKGRPRGSKNTATLVKEELDRKVSVREGSRVTKVSKRQVAIRNLSNKAAAGDAKALVTLIDLEGGTGTRLTPDVSFEGPPLSEKDRAILDNMRQELAATLSLSAQSAKKEEGP